MKNEKLTGIERELVLQYLIDGNVPVTVTPVESENDADTIHSVPSQIFPVVIKGENVKVSKSGEISLKNLPQSAVSFKSKNVKVEFYFNRVGVFFESKISETKDGYTIELPKEISRIQDVEEEHLYDFSSVIYFDFNNKKDLNIKCVPSKIVELFERPVWKLIPLENQKKAKDLLEKFVEEAKVQKNAGNGLLLIPVCNYLTFENTQFESIENRQKPVEILYIDHERIVVGFEQNDDFVQNEEFGIKLIFSLKKGPILTRDIFVTAFVNKIYKNENKFCIDFKYTTLQEEDMRFLYEKTTKSLFI
ncbi:MAG: hypothetical protein IJ937_06920 [Treponema sp.]|nr:hypothetical protein [Treponema sp.]MBR2106981.1 hypothetical protein [Treponema sp.]